MTTTELLVISPIIAGVLTAVAVLLVDLVAPARRSLTLGTAIVGLGVVLAFIVLAGASPGEAFGGAYTVDDLTTFLDILFVSIVGLTILFAPDYLEPRGLPVGEFAITILFAMVGAMLIAATTDLLLLFLAHELMVLPGYLLAGYHNTDGNSTEGAIKYFLLGSFSSAILLFGLAFIWGLTGTTRVAGVAEVLTGVVDGSMPFSPGLAMGLAFLSTGVAFKIAAVPFHYWTPDAYQGSPTPITGYLSVGPKIGAFALILRLFVEALGPLTAEWLPIVIVLAAITMTLGNLVALTQTNVKRMLAYSSIAHTRYMLVGLAAFGAVAVGSSEPGAGTAASDGIAALLFYGAAYTFMNLGAFAVVAAVQRRQGVTSNLETFAGLIRREPMLAILLTLFLLSLTGIPPTAGFFAKVLVIEAAVEAGGIVGWLAVLVVLNAAAAAFYYLRVVVYMFMRESDDERPALRSEEARGQAVVGGVVVIQPPVGDRGVAATQQVCGSRQCPRTAPQRSCD
jgi:NADH-quinone oxidoreductase subunit N